LVSKKESRKSSKKANRKLNKKANKKVNNSVDNNSAKAEKKAIRDGFSEGLMDAAKNDERIYAVAADVASSVGMKEFSEKYPDRFVEVGVAEQNLVTVASGLAMAGKIPFAASFAMFSPGRNWEQIRTTICYNDQPVKVVGSHAGIGVGEDGATHQALEDIALMRIIPNIEVIVPCDAIQAKKAVIAIAKTKSPTYIRIFRQKSEIITDEKTEFTIGKMQVFREGNDVCIISCGPIICNVLEAAEKLSASEISCAVINCHTIKPLDEDTLIKYAKKSKLIVVVEDHQINGGLGGAIAETLAKLYPRKMLFIGMNESFGESGSEQELYKKYKLDATGIFNTIKEELKISAIEERILRTRTTKSKLNLDKKNNINNMNRKNVRKVIKRKK
jgi:transketolase